jgi:hypothetical protein
MCVDEWSNGSSLDTSPRLGFKRNGFPCHMTYPTAKWGRGRQGERAARQAAALGRCSKGGCVSCWERQWTHRGTLNKQLNLHEIWGFHGGENFERMWVLQLLPWRWKQHPRPKCRLSSAWLQRVKTQKLRIWGSKHVHKKKAKKQDNIKLFVMTYWKATLK